MQPTHLEPSILNPLNLKASIPEVSVASILVTFIDWFQLEVGITLYCARLSYRRELAELVLEGLNYVEKD